jgi:signal transduction histidine kinase
MFTVSPAPLELRALVGRAVAACAMLAGDRRVDVTLPDADLWVLGDADQLAQVLENLIGNAIKYAPPETAVGVSAVAIDGRARVSVQDHGPGIPEDALERVFEKFYRVGAVGEDGHVDRGPAGLGLGLYICRRIVEAHGGRIWAENAPEGGSVFTVELAASRSEVAT